MITITSRCGIPLISRYLVLDGSRHLVLGRNVTLRRKILQVEGSHTELPGSTGTRVHYPLCSKQINTHTFLPLY